MGFNPFRGSALLYFRGDDFLQTRLNPAERGKVQQKYSGLHWWTYPPEWANLPSMLNEPTGQLFSAGDYLSVRRCRIGYWYAEHDRTEYTDGGLTQTITGQSPSDLFFPFARGLFAGIEDISPEPEAVQQERSRLWLTDGEAQSVPLYISFFSPEEGIAVGPGIFAVHDGLPSFILLRQGLKESAVETAGFAWTYLSPILSTIRILILSPSRSYFRDGDIDPALLFSLTDMTKSLRGMASRIRGMVAAARTLQDSPVPPEGKCHLPGKCSRCPRAVTLSGHHPFTLCDGLLSGKDGQPPVSVQLFQRGVQDLSEVEPGPGFSRKQNIQLQAIRSGQVWCDRDFLAGFLSPLAYPVCAIDFENLQSPIPLWNKSYSGEHVPFLYSLLVQSKPGGPIESRSYLHNSMDDPRPALARTLDSALPGTGTILVFYRAFEEKMISRLSGWIPGGSASLARAGDRIIDLHEPFRNFAVYHPEQYGSTSLKKIYSAFCGDAYTALPIQDGFEAGLWGTRAFIAGKEPVFPEEEASALVSYCDLDARALFSLLEVLQKLL